MNSPLIDPKIEEQCLQVIKNKIRAMYPTLSEYELNNQTTLYWNQLSQNPLQLNKFIRDNNIIIIEYTSAYWNTVKSANKMNPKTPPTILAEQIVRDWSSAENMAKQLVPAVISMKNTLKNLESQLNSIQATIESVLGYKIDVPYD